MVKRIFPPPHYVQVILFLFITFGLMVIIIKKEREFFKKKGDVFSQTMSELTLVGSEEVVIEKSIKRLKDIWEKGLLAFPKATRKLESNCREYFISDKVGIDYHKCNPQFLQCLFTQQFPHLSELLKIKIGNESVELELEARFESNPNYSQDKRVYEIYRNTGEEKYWGPDFGWRVDLNIKGMIIPIVLEDSCSTTYLPQKIYSYGAALDDAKEMLWDNMGRDYYVDKYLVTKRDVAEWKYFLREPWDFDARDAFMPSIELNLREREEYCLFRKKNMMKAEIFDAASMFLFKNGDRFQKGWFPWSRGKNDKFLKPEVEDKTVLTDLELQKLCQLVSVSECQKKHPYKFRSQMTPSWMGMFEVMGGVAETFHNTIDPELNLRASSMTFNRFSRNHILGVRGTWNGDLPAGFRCYREEFGE